MGCSGPAPLASRLGQKGLIRHLMHHAQVELIGSYAQKVTFAKPTNLATLRAIQAAGAIKIADPRRRCSRRPPSNIGGQTFWTFAAAAALTTKSGSVERRWRGLETLPLNVDGRIFMDQLHPPNQTAARTSVYWFTLILKSHHHIARWSF